MTSIESTDYLFDTGSDLGHEHMDLLARLFDPHSVAVLDPVITAGHRCLDVGAGGGSVTRWLADRAGPDGEVVAVDLDTTHLDGLPGVTAVRHDINEPLPASVAGPYDLVHARLTLMHLPWRDEIFARLVDQLAPGGWIVVGDLSARPLSVVTARSTPDVLLWQRVQLISHQVVSPAAGIDFGWAGRIDDAMTTAGLTHVHGIEVSHTAPGGSAGALLHASLNLQAHDHLLAAGATPWELERYQELTRDPEFCAWFYQFVCLRGQRPS